MKKTITKILVAVMALALVPTFSFATGEATGDTTTAGAALKIESKTDKAVYQKSETAKGTVTLTQTGQGTEANNVVVSQKIVENTGGITVSNVVVKLNGQAFGCTVDMDNEGNGFLVTTQRNLSVTDTLEVTYDIEMTNAVENLPIVTQTVAQADNISETKDYSVISVGNLTAGELAVSKASNGDEYQLGGSASYLVTVSQAQANGISEDIVITDTFDMGGAVIDLDTISVVKGDQNITASCDITEVESGIKIDTHTYLLGDSTITVAYEAQFADTSLSGVTLTNTANATANAGETATASKAVNIGNNPTLNMEKTADQDSYSTGDIAAYTISISEISDNATAENVVLSDINSGGNIDIESLVIEKSNEEGRIDITNECEVTGTDNEITVAVGDISSGETVTVEYNAEITAERGPILNTATVSSDNAEPLMVSNFTAYTSEDGITITKTSGKDNFEPGEELDYLVVYSSDNTINTSTLSDRFDGEVEEIKDVRVYEYVGEEALDISSSANVEFVDKGFDITLDYTTENEIAVAYTVVTGEEESYTNTATVNIDGDTAKAENTVTMSGESGGSGDSPKTGDILFMAVAIMALAGAGYAVSRKFSKA